MSDTKTQDLQQSGRTDARLKAHTDTLIWRCSRLVEEMKLCQEDWILIKMQLNPQFECNPPLNKFAETVKLIFLH